MSGEIFDSLTDSMFEFIYYERLNATRLNKSKNDEEAPIKLPAHTGIIIKTIFVKDENSGRKFPNKSYYDYEPTMDLSDLEKKDKKTISNILQDKVIDFIKTNNYLTDEFELIEKSTVKKTQAVKYEIKFSSFLSFNITLMPSDFNVDDVSIFIQSLPKQMTKTPKEGGKEKSSEGGDAWKVELAKSSRAACRTCGEKILKETIRVGQPSYFEDHLSYKWFHLTCVKNFKDSFPLEGVSDLNSENQALVKSTLYSGQKSGQKTDIVGTTTDPRDIIIQLVNDYQDSDGLTAERDIYKYAKEKGLQDDHIKEEIEKMEEEGLVYRPDQGKLKII